MGVETGFYERAQGFVTNTNLPGPVKVVGKRVLEIVNVFAFRNQEATESKISYVAREIFATLAKVTMVLAGIICTVVAIKGASIPFLAVIVSAGVFKFVRSYKLEIAKAKEPSELSKVIPPPVDPEFKSNEPVDAVSSDDEIQVTEK